MDKDKSDKYHHERAQLTELMDACYNISYRHREILNKVEVFALDLIQWKLRTKRAELDEEFNSVKVTTDAPVSSIGTFCGQVGDIGIVEIEGDDGVKRKCEVKIEDGQFCYRAIEGGE